MPTSTDYSFMPSLGELTALAYSYIGIRTTSLVQEHFRDARLAANMLLSTFSNRGLNLWKIDLVTIELVKGQAAYPVDSNTVTILDAYVSTDDGSGSFKDRIINPVSRSEYAAYPNKNLESVPTVFWFDRLSENTDMIGPGSDQEPGIMGPQIVLWPTPNGVAPKYLKFYREVHIQTANLQNSESPDIQYLWLEAFVDGLAYRLAKIWKPEMAAGLKAAADESYLIAAARNTERVNQYIVPQLHGYYRV